MIFSGKCRFKPDLWRNTTISYSTMDCEQCSKYLHCPDAHQSALCKLQVCRLYVYSGCKGWTSSSLQETPLLYTKRRVGQVGIADIHVNVSTVESLSLSSESIFVVVK
jgi:hypothetical protein